MVNEEYFNYHKHTMYSNIVTPDTHTKFEEYVDRCIELGHKYISACEHGSCGNIFNKYDILQSKKYKKYDLKMVACAELYITRDINIQDAKGIHHIILIARTKNAIDELNGLISFANQDGKYRRPRVDMKALLALNPAEWYVTTACIGGALNDLEMTLGLWKHFKDNLFIEVQNHSHEAQVEKNKLALQVAERLGLRIVHANDSHYVKPEDAFLRDIVLRSKGITYGDEDGFIVDFPDISTIYKRYQEQGVLTHEQVTQAIENTMLFTQVEYFEADYETKMPTIFPEWNEEQKLKHLQEIINIEFAKELPHIYKWIDSEDWKIFVEETGRKVTVKDYQNAIREEYAIIRDTHTVDYFLSNYYVMKKGKEYGGVLTRTGRGSGPSFYINYLLRFTEIDRLRERVKLFPSRFLSIARISSGLPDIDFNTADDAPFVRASKEIFGEQNVYKMVSFGTMQFKSAFKNVCRAYNIHLDLVEEIIADYDSKVPQNDEDAESAFIDKYLQESEWREIFEITRKLIGTIESISENACGYLLYTGDIRRKVGIFNTRKGDVCLIDKTTADRFRFLKNDYLIVTVWEIIDKVCKSVGIPIPSIRELNGLIDGNEKVWRLYDDGITATLNQVTSSFAIDLVKQYKPRSIDDMSHFVAAIRPSFASERNMFITRTPFSYGISAFDELLKTSAGFVLYQENIMDALGYAGFPMDETYNLIKAISKKVREDIMAIKPKFVERFTKVSSAKDAEHVWQIIEDASAYGFNASHSLSVAYDSLYGAWLKATYPLEYYTTVLNIYANDLDHTKAILNELKEFDIKMIHPTFGHTENDYTFDRATNTIYKGLGSVKHLNSNVAGWTQEVYNKHNIIEWDYDTMYKMFIDVKMNSPLNKTHVETLIKLDFFKNVTPFGKKLFKWYEVFHEKYTGKWKTEKSFAKYDEMFKNLWVSLPEEEWAISELAKHRYELEGQVGMVAPEMEPTYAIILNIDGIYANKKVTLYHFCDGTQTLVHIHQDLIDKYDVKQFDVINCIEVQEKAIQVPIKQDGKVVSWKKLDRKRMQLVRFNQVKFE